MSLLRLFLVEFLSKRCNLLTLSTAKSGAQTFTADLKTRRTIANEGVDMFLHMMFTDNFVHGDLHPGNILVQNVSPEGRDSTFVQL